MSSVKMCFVRVTIRRALAGKLRCWWIFTDTVWRRTSWKGCGILAERLKRVHT
jgi:hypothetical protein